MTRYLNRPMVAGVVCVGIAIFYFVVMLRNVLILFTPAIDLYENTDWSTLKNGAHIRTNLDVVYDYFYYTEDEDRDIIVKKAYMIPNLGLSEEEEIIKEFIGVEVKLADGFEEYESAIETSYDWLYEMGPFPEPTIQLDGYLRKMNSEEQDFMVEYLVEGWDLTEEEAKDYVCPYMVIPYDSGKAKSSLLLSGGLFLVGAIMIPIGIFIGRKRY